VVSGSNIFAGIDGGVFLSANNGKNWSVVNNGLTNTNIHHLNENGLRSWVFAFAVNGANLFTGTFGGVFLSTDNGSSWTEVNNGLTNTHVYALALSCDLLKKIFAGTGGGGVFLSTDNGKNWTSTGLKKVWVSTLLADGRRLFAGTGDGSVFLSTDNGTTWTAVNDGLTNTHVYSLAMSGMNLFAGTNNGVFLSTNYGTSWAAVNIGLSNLEVQAIAVNGTNLFVGTFGGGVFFSTNNGTSWTEVNNNLTATSILSLAVNDTNLFAGTYAHGVWRLPIIVKNDH
jgi:photosystem II stability/assembly factor-like uncharacterized protein